MFADLVVYGCPAACRMDPLDRISLRYINGVVIGTEEWEKLKTNKHLDAPVGKVLTGF